MSIYVNSERVEPGMVQQELQMLMERYGQEMTPQEMQEQQEQIQEDAKQNAIERLILIQEARKEVPEVPDSETEQRYGELQQQYGGPEQFKQRMDLTPETEQEIKERVADGIRLESYFEDVTKDVQTPGEEECRAFYEEHKSDYAYPEMVRASHIVRSPEEGQTPQQLMAEMMNIREKLLKGAEFADVANARSQCDDDGGDLGWFPRGQMVPEFEDVVFKMQPGEISDVFETPFGFHIVKLFDKKEGGHRDFEDVRYEIENRLIEEQKNEKIGEIVDKLRQQAIIEETDEAEEEQQ